MKVIFRNVTLVRFPEKFVGTGVTDGKGVGKGVIVGICDMVGCGVGTVVGRAVGRTVGNGVGQAAWRKRMIFWAEATVPSLTQPNGLDATTTCGPRRTKTQRTAVSCCLPNETHLERCGERADRRV